MVFFYGAEEQSYQLTVLGAGSDSQTTSADLRNMNSPQPSEKFNLVWHILREGGSQVCSLILNLEVG